MTGTVAVTPGCNLTETGCAPTDLMCPPVSMVRRSRVGPPADLMASATRAPDGSVTSPGRRTRPVTATTIVVVGEDAATAGGAGTAALGVTRVDGAATTSARGCDRHATNAAMRKTATATAASALTARRPGLSAASALEAADAAFPVEASGATTAGQEVVG